jgi:hypothetical protein
MVMSESAMLWVVAASWWWIRVVAEEEERLPKVKLLFVE